MPSDRTDSLAFLSQNRLDALLAAEAACQALRADIADRGGMTKRCWPWFERWMRLAGQRRYKTPKSCRPVWCSNCKKYHVSGECKKESM